MKIFKNMLSHSAVQRKEKLVIAVTLTCFTISGIALPQIKAQEGLYMPDASVVQQEQATETADTSNSLKKEKETADKQKDEETTKEEKEETEEEKDSSDDKNDNEKAADKNSSEHNKAANSNSSGASTSSNNNSGSSPSAPARQPEKVWVPPVYKTVHHDAVYNTITVVVCNYCGAEFGSAGEFQVHKDANGG